MPFALIRAGTIVGWSTGSSGHPGPRSNDDDRAANVVLTIVLVTVALFAALNWPRFAEPTPLNAWSERSPPPWA